MGLRNRIEKLEWATGNSSVEKIDIIFLCGVPVEMTADDERVIPKTADERGSAEAGGAFIIGGPNISRRDGEAESDFIARAERVLAMVKDGETWEGHVDVT